jgi:sortase (surface protein transpeptidase)
VQPLGLLPDQTVGVPNSYTEVGWYSGGVSPGEVGPSVILGHVDSVDGPAIFYSLGQVKVDDEIEVIREDGTIAKFKVTSLERHSQSDFPTMDVYGPVDKAVLRLVTCSGQFDRGSQRYSHNLIVFAELVQ